jgi:predicted NodU family carbamoyl transferase
MTAILGISAFYHDAAAALVIDGMIVCAPEEAYRCFMRTNIDALAIERFILLKDEQPRVPARAPRHTFAPLAVD